MREGTGTKSVLKHAKTAAALLSLSLSRYLSCFLCLSCTLGQASSFWLSVNIYVYIVQIKFCIAFLFFFIYGQINCCAKLYFHFRYTHIAVYGYFTNIYRHVDGVSIFRTLYTFYKIVIYLSFSIYVCISFSFVCFNFVPALCVCVCLCVLGIGCAPEPHLVELNTFSCTNTYILVCLYIKYTYLHYLNTYVLFVSFDIRRC